MSKQLNKLVVDVGGTNIRFGLLADTELRPRHVESYRIDNYPGMTQAMGEFLDQAPDHRLSEASIAVATPVSGDKIRLTNHNWSFSISAIRNQFGLQRVKVINDFTALALSIPLLEKNELQQVGGGSADPEGAIALLGAGTGLGVSGLIKSAAGWYPLSGEGGHVTLGARNQRELSIFAAFWEKYGHISAERLLSGTGLEELHHIVCTLDGLPADKLKPQEISARAMQNTCPACSEVMTLFCDWFGIVAANLVLTLGAAGGVYIGGGIVPKLGEYFTRSGFRGAFETKGRFRGYMESVPVFIIQADYPALRGAAVALENRFDKLGVQC